MRIARYRITLAAVLSVVAATAAAVALSVGGGSADQVRPDAGWQAAPYLYLGADGPSAAQVMAATGVRRFTLAFIVSGGGCRPAWDNGDPLTGAAESAVIREIRAAGGDVAVSFGGMGGAKLGVVCSSPEALAGAWQEVVAVYRLRAIDLDAEGAEIGSAAVRQRMASALAIIRHRDPGLAISVTFGTDPSGPGPDARDLIRRAAAADVRADAWTIMPFDFSAPVLDMGRASIQAAEALRAVLMSAYHEQAAAAYRSMGISSMNGRTDTGEVVRLSDFQAMLRYARAHHLARFTFWSVNRDQPCAGAHTTPDSCSGIAQSPYAYTRAVAGYRG